VLFIFFFLFFDCYLMVNKDEYILKMAHLKSNRDIEYWSRLSNSRCYMGQRLTVSAQRWPLLVHLSHGHCMMATHLDACRTAYLLYAVLRPTICLTRRCDHASVVCPVQLTKLTTEWPPAAGAHTMKPLTVMLKRFLSFREIRLVILLVI